MDGVLPDKVRGGADPDEASRFRILRRGNWRRALRLEPIFWTALELAARENSMKLTDYVRTLIPDGGRAGNQTSRLRAHAAQWMHERLIDSERRLAESGPARMLKAVPLPGFIIGGERGLIAYNGDFMKFVHDVADKERIPRVSDARLNLDAPIERIVETLRESTRPALECGFHLTLNDRRIRGRVRASLVPGTGRGPDVMGFITTVERARSSAA
jgi:predicted DNA-binding ribbon-helix-helix protein